MLNLCYKPHKSVTSLVKIYNWCLRHKKQCLWHSMRVCLRKTCAVAAAGNVIVVVVATIIVSEVCRTNDYRNSYRLVNMRAVHTTIMIALQHAICFSKRAWEVEHVRSWQFPFLLSLRCVRHVITITVVIIKSNSKACLSQSTCMATRIVFMYRLVGG